MSSTSETAGTVKVRARLGPRIGMTVAVLVLCTALFTTIAERWRIGGVGPNDPTSLPPHWAFAIDLQDKTIDRGHLFGFSSDGRMAPYYAEGTTFVKIAAALPGDRVTVRKDSVYINGEKQAEGLALAATLGQKPEAFLRDEIVPEGKVWALTPAPDSFDSRYWGYVDRSRVLGRAYVVF